MSKDKSWKKILLSSGCPFEGTVKQYLAAISGFENRGTYYYDRRNEQGMLIEHSIDFLGSISHAEHTIHTEFLIEVKYRQPETMWVFPKLSFGNPQHPRLSSLFISLDNLCGNRRLDNGYIDSFSKHYKLGERPLELRPTSGGKLQKGSEDYGYRQLAFAAATRIAQLLISQASYNDSNLTPLYIIVPIIVTTAGLKIAKAEWTNETVMEAEDLNDLVEDSGLVMAYERPCYEIEDHIHQYLANYLTKSQRMRLLERLRDSGYSGIDEYVKVIQEKYPTLMMVIEENEFVDHLTKLVDFTGRSEVVCTSAELLGERHNLVGNATVI